MFVSDYTVAVFGSSNSVLMPEFPTTPNLVRNLIANHPLSLNDAWQLPQEITFTEPEQMRFLTRDEQQIMHQSLRSSVKIIARGKA